jgi:hypothetical protein
MRDDWRAARADGQRKRIIALLETLADADSKDQCRMCGEWFDNVAAHKRHCDGPE